MHHVAGHLGGRLPATPPPRGALDDEELFIIEGSKNWRSTLGQPRGARKWRKMRRKNPSSHPTAESNLSLLQTGMSTISGDELILRHFQQRDCVAAYSQGRPHLVDELQQQGQRPLCQSTATAGPSQF